MMMKGNEMTAKAPTKRSVAIAIMNANVQEPVPFVAGLIADAIGVTQAKGRAYYLYIVKHGLSNVPSEAFAKTPKAPKPKAVKAVKTKAVKTKAVKAPKLKFDMIVDKSFPEPDNLDRLALIRQTHQRMLAEGRIVTHGAKFNYDTREFEDSAPETNEVEDLCEMFSV